MDASLSLAAAPFAQPSLDDAQVLSPVALPWETDVAEPAPVRSAPRKIRRSGAIATRAMVAERLPWGVMVLTALTAMLLVFGARTPDSGIVTFDISTTSR